MIRWGLGWLLLVALMRAPLAADASDADANGDAGLARLIKMQAAARELDYSGVYTYQQGSVISSSRIVHLVDGTGERERVQTLDGQPREFIRHNDTTHSLLPEHRLIVVDKRRTDRFPALFLGDVRSALHYYEVATRPDPDRVAGRDCVVMRLRPVDAHRYGHVLCIDAETHLLLRAQTVTANREVIDQVAFASLALGEEAAKDPVTPQWDTSDWKTVEVTMTAIDLAGQGWRIPRPAGFDVVTQVARPLRRDDHVNQLVLSDGLAALSVFIEPFSAQRHGVSDQGGVHKGVLSVYRKRIGEHWLTVVGQVPADTVRDLTEHVEYVPLAR